MIAGFTYSEVEQVGEGISEFIVGDMCYAVKVPVIVELSSKGYLYVYHHMTEQGQTLYGFTTSEDRTLFKDLISVDGVGPALALKIMSFYSTDKIRIDIADGDKEDMCKAKGVGAKSAEKIITALRDKYRDYATKKLPHKALEVSIATVSKQGVSEEFQAVFDAARKALIKLGLSASDAKGRILKAWPSCVSETTEFAGPMMDELASKIVQAALRG